MKRSPIIDTSVTLTSTTGIKVIIHDGRVPHPSRPDLNDGDFIIRRKGGYTCNRIWDHVGNKPCWTASPSSNVELVAEWIKELHPDVYNTITWSGS